MKSLVSKITYLWELIALILLLGSVSVALIPLMDDLFTSAEEDAVTVYLNTHESGGWSFNTPPLGTQTQNEEAGNIILKKGESAKIFLIGGDVIHSFVISDLGINSGPITPGKTKVIEFTPDQSGTFTIYCGVICSPEHHFLVYNLVVMEPDEFEDKSVKN